jgi:hypothetical protein
MSLALTIDLAWGIGITLDLGSVGSRPLDAALQASKEVAVASTFKHPINAANLDQLLDEFENDLVAASAFAASRS